MTDEEEFRYTQNIVIRADIRMSCGKMCAQVAHAAVAACEESRRSHGEWLREWLREGQRKVVLKVNSLDELIGLKIEADRLNIPNALIEDRGLTELSPGTVTCLAIGPAPRELIDKITGRLKLVD
ncbi:peptidyl-tRNA hydrolase Pth2 [Candidatus Bathyarchaeota archaeon]|nr:peptidyl-tRNA hydrolase Pth2 [Candidatus Bathyarchaeota archaeon]MBS7612754.1 peptidyl-tRNA hydrolase Pth2 [Candidatus Bathyarchaeota archaeon]MBS7617725.1 peptidyl-tRNA hydrolase Pth2 [Candidatus Bathyarchaeota archaeon]